MHPLTCLPFNIYLIILRTYCSTIWLSRLPLTPLRPWIRYWGKHFILPHFHGSHIQANVSFSFYGVKCAMVFELKQAFPRLATIWKGSRYTKRQLLTLTPSTTTLHCKHMMCQGMACRPLGGTLMIRFWKQCWIHGLVKGTQTNFPTWNQVHLVKKRLQILRPNSRQFRGIFGFVK